MSRHDDQLRIGVIAVTKVPCANTCNLPATEETRSQTIKLIPFALNYKLHPETSTIHNHQSTIINRK